MDTGTVSVHALPMHTAASFPPAQILETLGVPAWVKRRITMFEDSEKSLRIEMRGGKIDIQADGNQRTTEIVDAGQRMVCMIVPAKSAHGQLRAPNTDAAFVAVYADRLDNLVGRGVNSVSDVQGLLGGIIF